MTMPTKTIASVGLALILFAIAPTEMHAKTQTQNIEFDRHTGSHTYEQSATVKVARNVKTKRGKRQHRDNIPHKYAAHRHGGNTASLDAVTPKLAEKAREIIAACGAKVISAYRPGARVRGYGTPSLHSRYPAEAIDMTGDTSCIYPHLRGWAGGYSVDYAAVQHIHISLASDRRERGARFAHYGTRRYARR